jgi:phospholipid/cholesterol/gamma-HCH transport system substrate-binding protein
MSKQANKTVIGIFVVVAIALAVAAVLILGSGKFFKQTLRAVCYFEGSVGGLNVGAPVVFRGVKIGSVTDVILNLNTTNLIFTIPVYIEIEPDKVTVAGVRPRQLGRNLKAFIDRGLRATLEMQSIVTGQMQVGLDFYPDKPAKFAENRTDTKTPEIPTVPTPMQELAKKIQKLPIDQIFEKLDSALDEIDKLVKSPEIPEAIRSVNLALEDIRKLVKDVDGQVGPLTSNLNNTVLNAQRLVQNADAKVTGLASNLDGAVTEVRGLVQNADAKVTGLASNLDGAVTEVRGLVKNVDDRTGPLTASMEGTLKSIDATLIVVQKAMDSTAGEGSPMVYEMNRTLEEVHALARSIRVLVDHLERRPESLIRGK